MQLVLIDYIKPQYDGICTYMAQCERNNESRVKLVASHTGLLA